MSLKIGDGKPLAANVTSNNKLQLKFKNSQFVGEYFHYSGDLFLIYNSGQLARLTCVRSLFQRDHRPGDLAIKRLADVRF